MRVDLVIRPSLSVNNCMTKCAVKMFPSAFVKLNYGTNIRCGNTNQSYIFHIDIIKERWFYSGSFDLLMNML